VFARVSSSIELCALSVSALSPLCLTLSLFGAKTEKLSPAFSLLSALFKKTVLQQLFFNQRFPHSFAKHRGYSPSTKNLLSLSPPSRR
jgi:hypothetical protein